MKIKNVKMVEIQNAFVFGVRFRASSRISVLKMQSIFFVVLFLRSPPGVMENLSS